MPYKNIVFVKVEMELFEDDRFLIDLNDRQKGLYLMLLVLAGKTKNKIRNDENFIKLRLNLSSLDMSDLEKIAHIFKKFKLVGNYWRFENFSRIHNYILGEDQKNDHREIPGNSLGNTKEELGSVQNKKENKNKKENTTMLSELVAFKDLWNSVCKNLPTVKELSEVRKQKIRLRLKDRPLEAWALVFKQIGGSEFCCGKNDKGWKASFDWIIENDNNAIKVLEGKYDSRKTPGFSGAGKIPAFRVDSTVMLGNRTETNQVLSKQLQPGNVS